MFDHKPNFGLLRLLLHLQLHVQNREGLAKAVEWRPLDYIETDVLVKAGSLRIILI